MCNRYNSIRYFIVFGFMFLLACKKDKDISGPVIEIYSPVENQAYNVLDVIPVSGGVNDENKITSVTVSLVNSLQQSAHVGVSVPITSPNMNFNIQYPLDNIHLESGTYYIMVTASDGENDTRKFQKIYLNEVPRKLEKVYVVSNTGNSSTNWSYTDSALTSIIPFKTFSGDYIGSSLSSYYKQLFNCGNYTGDYSSYDLATNTIKYVIQGSISSTPYFTGYSVSGKNTYLARYDEFVKGYDYKGNPIFNAACVDGYFTKHFIFNDGKLVAEQQNKISSSKILVTYFSTGFADVQTSIAQDVVCMIEKDNSNIFIFGNNAGQATLQLFDRTNNNLWNPYPFSLAAGNLLSAVKIDENTYLIGHSNGTIYKYQYPISSVTTYASGYVAKQLKYDAYFNKLYVVENNKITRLDYTSTTAEATVVSGENILDIHLLYNR